jgi:hypothetical protein
MRRHLLTYEDAWLCAELELAGGCSLDESPGSNWVQKEGGLPEYICKVARAIKRSGKSTSTAIAMAISRIKAWIVDPDTKPDTKAKCVAAIAQWERLRAKSHMKTTAEHEGLLYKLTGQTTPFEGHVDLHDDVSERQLEQIIALTAITEIDLPCRDVVNWVRKQSSIGM